MRVAFGTAFVTGLVGALLVVVVTAQPARAELVEVQAQAARCDDYDLDSLASALGRLHGLLVRPGARGLHIGSRTISASTYANRTVLPLLEAAGAGDRDRLCALIARMTWWRGAPLQPQQLLFSAYYTPSVPGSLVRDERFRWPLYRRPPGSEATRYDTAQVLAGALAHRNLELVWLEEGYDALALHVEGAASITLPDGSSLAIGTDGTNGKPYTNVSKLLIADHKMPRDATPSTKPGSPKARAYFAAHPDELVRYWSKNPHYVWWKRVPQVGTAKLGILTNGRSIAIDPGSYPLGAIVLLRPVRPFPGGDGTPARLVVAMDTGAAIRGPGRIDVYLGDEGTTTAATVSQASVQGDAYVLLGR